MGDLSQHFNRREFKCSCGTCGQDQVDYELVVLLERLRETVGQPITITSGNRCHAHNMNIGGSKGSQHLWSKAADIQVKGHSPERIYAILDGWYPEQYGIGIYRSWIHVDVRNHKARWDKR